MSLPARSLPLALGVALVSGATLALPAAARAPARMLVIAQEWSLTLSRGSVPAGALTVQLYDRGQDAHNLNIRRVGSRRRMVGRTQKLSLTQSGGLTQAAWRLAPGRYELYCSLPQHAKLGMRAFLTVR
jgi:plastocyanin